MIVGASPVETLPIVAIYGASKNRFTRYKLKSGNYPEKNEVIVGSAIAQQLLDKKSVQIANKVFHISGIFSSDIGFENGGVVMGIEDAGKIFNKSASMILVNVALSSDIKTVLKDTKVEQKY
jgi:hypothetical protein